MTETVLQVTEIERFALHDGPGIRTTVFLKGCSLHCPWCANPETIYGKKQLLHLQNKCKCCGACARICPFQVVDMTKNGPVFHRENCRTCGTCKNACMYGAIRYSGIEMTISDILSEVMRDNDYYEASGGGLTISGGEPFFQPEGLCELLLAGKQKGLHTAIETSGSVLPEKFAASFPYTDLYMVDLKHFDADILREKTGANLTFIIENLRNLVSEKKRIMVRIPVIPGFNFAHDDLLELFEIVQSLRIQEIDLLPYHTLGMNKYAWLGQVYDYPEKETLLKDDLIQFRDLGREKGLHVTISGT